MSMPMGTPTAHRQRQADDDPEHRVADVDEQGAVEHHPGRPGADRETDGVMAGGSMPLRAKTKPPRDRAEAEGEEDPQRAHRAIMPSEPP